MEGVRRSAGSWDEHAFFWKYLQGAYYLPETVKALRFNKKCTFVKMYLLK